MEKRRFTGFPFKIPLLWAMDTGIPSFFKNPPGHIEIYAGKIDLEKFIGELKETPGPQLLPFDKKAILNVAEKWQALSTHLLKTVWE